MHHQFSFLLALPEAEDRHADVSDIEIAASGAIVDRYAHHHCDENNWYDEQAVLLRDGRLLDTAGPSRSRDNDPAHSIARELDAEPHDRWTAAFDVITRQCARAIHLPSAPDTPIDSQTRDTLLRRIRDEVPLTLAARYARRATEDTNDTLETIRRREQAHMFEAFHSTLELQAHLDSGDTLGHLPFVEPLSPYVGWPAIDLTDDATPNAICFVDIHT